MQVGGMNWNLPKLSRKINNSRKILRTDAEEQIEIMPRNSTTINGPTSYKQLALMPRYIFTFPACSYPRMIHWKKTTTSTVSIALWCDVMWCDVMWCDGCMGLLSILHKCSSPARRKQLPELLPVCGASLTYCLALRLFFMMLHVRWVGKLSGGLYVTITGKVRHMTAGLCKRGSWKFMCKVTCYLKSASIKHVTMALLSLSGCLQVSKCKPKWLRL